MHVNTLKKLYYIRVFVICISMAFVKTWVLDNVVGTMESVVLSDQESFQRKVDRAVATISDETLPQESVRQIFSRFPEMLDVHFVRTKLLVRMRKYCSSNYVRAQSMFDDIRQKTPGVVSRIGKLLAQTNVLLFFRNSELYNKFQTNLGPMYETLTNKQKKEFAEKVLATHGYLLRALNKTSRTKYLCSLAVSSNGIALEYVPEQFKTKALMKLAVSESGYALQYVKKNYQTQLLCSALCVAGLNILKQPWFAKLFDTLSKAEQKVCTSMERSKRQEEEDRWSYEYH